MVVVVDYPHITGVAGGRAPASRLIDRLGMACAVRLFQNFLGFTTKMH